MEDQLFLFPLLNKIPNYYLYLGGIDDGNYIEHLDGRNYIT